MSAPPSNLQLRSLIKKSGELELSLVAIDMPQPAANQVVVRIEAAPINPSDIGLLFGPADLSTLAAAGTAAIPIVTGRVPDKTLPGLKNRLDQSLPAGNEGAGTVVSAGSAAAAQQLMGRMVAVIGGAMYSQYRCVDVDQCMVLPEGTAASAGAALYVNPLTALGMVETMRREGHRALVHTAAASSLGRMLVRISLADRIPLVNIVRKAEQVDLLRTLGATHVCRSDAPEFHRELTRALIDTGATLGFDAIGGGKLADQILSAMEAALNAADTTYKRYGSDTHKQVYIYGGLSREPTELRRSYGMSWGVGGWLLFPTLERFGPEVVRKLKGRIVAEMKTTFASTYSQEISLSEALQPGTIAKYAPATTGTKYLIDPTKDFAKR